jgi:hypothetical protein
LCVKKKFLLSVEGAQKVREGGCGLGAVVWFRGKGEVCEGRVWFGCGGSIKWGRMRLGEFVVDGNSIYLWDGVKQQQKQLRSQLRSQSATSDLQPKVAKKVNGSKPA